MIDASISPWPQSGNDLCQLLHISSAPTLKCHGLTKKKETCRRDLSAKNAKTIRELLENAAKAGNFDDAHDVLEELSCLVLCPKNHRYQCVDLLSGWERFLRADNKRNEAASKKPKEEKGKSTKETKVKEEPVTIKLEELEPKAEPRSSPPKPVKAEPTPEPVPAKSKTDTPKHTFVPYGPELSARQINIKIKKSILKPLSSKELDNMSNGGSVYVYSFPENYHDPSPYVKIGCTKDYKGRMKQWERQCKYEPRLICNFTVHLYKRVEALVHGQLGNSRLREKECPTCHISHIEWFASNTYDVSTVGILWSSWTRQQPYDETGNLKDKWAQRLKTLDLNDPMCWVEFVHGKW